MVQIHTECPRCTTAQFIMVPAEGLAAYRAGAYIQDAFPGLSADEREALKTGICAPCWDSMFADE